MWDTDDWRWRRRLRHFFNNDAMRDRAEVRPRKDKRGVDLISNALSFGRLWYGEPNAIEYAKHRSRSHHAVIRVYDETGNVIETHKHAGRFPRILITSSRE
jgi:hypothetical protein